MTRLVGASLLFVIALATPAPAAAQASPSPDLPAGSWCTGWDGRQVTEVAISPDGGTIAVAAEDTNGSADILTLSTSEGTAILIDSGLFLWGAGIAVAADGTVALPMIGEGPRQQVLILAKTGGVSS